MSYTQEQLDLLALRMQSDAELINQGATYVLDGDAAEPRLQLTEGQIGAAREEMEDDFTGRIQGLIDQYGVKRVDEAVGRIKGMAPEPSLPGQGQPEPVHEKPEPPVLVHRDRFFSRDEILMLLERVREGYDESAKEAIVQNFEPMVESVVQKYFGGMNPEDLEDLRQEGRLAIVNAIEKYDPDRGAKFSSYVRNGIWQMMYRWVQTSSSIIKIPMDVRHDILQVVRAKDRLAMELGRNPSEAELADAVGYPQEAVQDLLEIRRITDVISVESLDEYADVLALKKRLDTGMEREAALCRLEECLECLTPRERAIIFERFGMHDGFEKTLAEVGAIIGVNKERVRQIEFQALKKMRGIADASGNQNVAHQAVL